MKKFGEWSLGMGVVGLLNWVKPWVWIELFRWILTMPWIVDYIIDRVPSLVMLNSCNGLRDRSSVLSLRSKQLTCLLHSLRIDTWERSVFPWGWQVFTIAFVKLIKLTISRGLHSVRGDLMWLLRVDHFDGILGICSPFWIESLLRLIHIAVCSSSVCLLS